jgi:ribonuclease HI
MCKHKKAYRNTRILIFSDGQAARKALSGTKVTSELLADCLNAPSSLAGLNEVTFVRVPGHCGIPGNEQSDRLARRASALPLPGPEPALGVLAASVV